MNLKMFQAALKTYSDYNPTSDIYNDELDGIINQAYWMLWTARQWTFANVEETISFFADLNFARTGSAVTIGQFERQVVFNVAVGPLAQHWEWEGQVIELSGVDYEILMIDGTSIRLAEPYKGPALALDETWIIKHRYYYLPENCINLLSVTNSDNPVPGSNRGGKMFGLQPAHVTIADLSQDTTATTADAYWEVPPVNVPPGEKIGLLGVEHAAGTIPDSQSYEICWAFEGKGGRVGPLSQPEIVNLGVAEQGLGWTLEIAFLSHDDQPIAAPAFAFGTDTYPNPYEGLRKRLYFNQNFNRSTGERLGLPLWRQINYVGSTLGALAQYDTRPVRVLDEDSSFTLTVDGYFQPGNARYIEFDGQHRRIQPYPRIDGFDFHYEALGGQFPVPEEEWVMFGKMKYNYKPHMLASVTDSPELPYEFHDLLTWAALADLSRKHSDNATSLMYERRVEKRVKDLAKRYAVQVDVEYRRGQFGTGSCGLRSPWPMIVNGVKIY